MTTEAYKNDVLGRQWTDRSNNKELERRRIESHRVGGYNNGRNSGKWVAKMKEMNEIK